MQSNKFVIFAPHYDDELIGCNRFLERYCDQIEKIIYFTDSSLSSTFLGKSTMMDILKRQSESMQYLENIKPGLSEKAICLNIPDGLTAEECVEKCHLRGTAKDLSNEILRMTADICKDCVIVFPMLDTNHTSHIWCYQHCKILKKALDLKSIEYQCHELLMGKDIVVAGTREIKTRTKYGKWVNTYTYGQDEKDAIFKKFFEEQHADFRNQGIKLKNWEKYQSEVDITLEKSLIII